MRLLLVEDDPDLGEALVANLARDGFSVDLAADLATAEASLGTGIYDLVLLDLTLPDGDGIELLRHLKRRRSTVPVLVVTARDAVEDRVTGLEAGADDYLVKPFAHAELVARIRAVLRRPGRDLGAAIEIGRLLLETTTGHVEVAGRPLLLPRRERMLLEALMRRAGRVVTRRILEEALWDQDSEIESNTLESHVSRLRKKLTDAGAGVQIRTVRGVGYMLEVE
jgi:DNA-binding response OmpR family regulator